MFMPPGVPTLRNTLLALLAVLAVMVATPSLSADEPAVPGSTRPVPAQGSTGPADSSLTAPWHCSFGPSCVSAQPRGEIGRSPAP